MSWVLDHHGSALTEALAPGLYDLGFDVFLRRFLLELLDEFQGAGCLARRAAAHTHAVRVVFGAFLQELLAQGIEVILVLKTFKREFHVRSSLS